MVADVLGVGSINLNRPVIMDCLPVVVLNGRIHVVLGVDANQFVALGIVHDHFVIAAATGGAVRLEAAHHILLGQRIGWHQFLVVDFAHDDRLIRIAFQKIDDHLLADARNSD